jgi:hypothetical protein
LVGPLLCHATGWTCRHLGRIQDRL